jgi:hypothetical protein
MFVREYGFTITEHDPSVRRWSSRARTERSGCLTAESSLMGARALAGASLERRA